MRENDEFIDIAIQATHVALRTSQEEKKDALKNAVLKSASPESPDLSLQQIFINYIDSFTKWHIKILDLWAP